MSLVLEIMLGNEIQRFLRFLKIFMKYPEDLKQIQLFCCLVFRSQFVEFSAFSFIVFRTDPYLCPNLWSEEAVSGYNKGLQPASGDIFLHLALAGAYSIMDREEEARAEGAEVLRCESEVFSG